MKEQFLITDFTSKFKVFLKLKLEEIERKIIKHSSKGNTDILKNYAKAVTHVLKGESSLSRPLFVLSSALCFGLSQQATLEVAFCIELIHSMSLIIDDLPSMDNANVRRGRPTTHKLYGENQAILAAISLYTYALQTCSLIKAPGYDQAIKYLLKCLHKVISGQVIDIKLSFNQANSDKIEEMHVLKTAYLIRPCLVVPALLTPDNGTKPFVIKQLEEVANSIGLAYQIRDDFLDVLSEEIETGKSNNLDIMHQKPSYVLFSGMANSMARLVSLFNIAFNAIQTIEKTCQYYYFGVLKVLLERLFIKSLELKVFLPVQVEQIKKHYPLIANGLNKINREDVPDKFLHYYAYGICFPIYSPNFKLFFSGFESSHKQLEINLIKFFKQQVLNSMPDVDDAYTQGLKLSGKHEYMAAIELKKIQGLRFPILVSLAANTKIAKIDEIILQLLTDFLAYITYILTNKNLNTFNGTWMAFIETISAYLLQSETVTQQASSDSPIGHSLGLRLKSAALLVYGKYYDLHVSSQSFIESLSVVFKQIVPKKQLNINMVSYKTYVSMLQETSYHMPIFKLAYLLLGVANIESHKNIPIKELEQMTVLAIAKFNNFILLRCDMQEAGFTLIDIHQFYTTDLPLQTDIRLPINLIILRALENRISLNQAIFQELAEYTALIDAINQWIKYYLPYCSPQEAQALIIMQRWSTFAHSFWSLMIEKHTGSYEHVYNVFETLCMQNQSVGVVDKKIRRDHYEPNVAFFGVTRSQNTDTPSAANKFEDEYIKAKL